MKNPYVRLRELCGLTQKAFCQRNDFGKMTMVYLEAGMYTKVSERQNIALGKECANRGVDAKSILQAEYGTESLTVAYMLWRSEQRKNSGLILPTTFRSTTTNSPVAMFVADSTGSMQRFCKTVKIQPATMTRYAKGETASMPRELRTALEEMGYTATAALEKAQADWVQETL